jgi:hypothetical protein
VNIQDGIGTDDDERDLICSFGIRDGKRTTLYIPDEVIPVCSVVRGNVGDGNDENAQWVSQDKNQPVS